MPHPPVLASVLGVLASVQQPAATRIWATFGKVDRLTNLGTKCTRALACKAKGAHARHGRVGVYDAECCGGEDASSCEPNVVGVLGVLFEVCVCVVGMGAGPCG